MKGFKRIFGSLAAFVRSLRLRAENDKTEEAQNDKPAAQNCKPEAGKPGNAGSARAEAISSDSAESAGRRILCGEAEESEPAEALRGKRILLCEDNAINAQIVACLLERCGCETVWAENGAEGLARFGESGEGDFDAVLMDVRMPQMNGLDAARELRRLKREDARRVPIIAMTAGVLDSDLRDCLAAGMSGYLAKPVESRLLYRTLAEQLQPKQGGK